MRMKEGSSLTSASTSMRRSSLTRTVPASPAIKDIWRYYYVGCPDPEPRWGRNTLVLSLSGDGAAFDRHYVLGDDRYEIEFPGMCKGGDYGYPHTLYKDGYLYVIYSAGKERIHVLRTAADRLPSR